MHLHIHLGSTRPFFQRHLHFNRCLRTAKSNPNVPFNCNGHVQGGLGQPHLSRPQSWHRQSQAFLVLEHTCFICISPPLYMHEYKGSQDSLTEWTPTSIWLSKTTVIIKNQHVLCHDRRLNFVDVYIKKRPNFGSRLLRCVHFPSQSLALVLHLLHNLCLQNNNRDSPFHFKTNF